jgi:hypothetical protein
MNGKLIIGKMNDKDRAVQCQKDIKELIGMDIIIVKNTEDNIWNLYVGDDMDWEFVIFGMIFIAGFTCGSLYTNTHILQMFDR